MRRRFWITFWGTLAVAVWRGALLRANVRNLRLHQLSDNTPIYLRLSWGYSAGARPQSIIFDLDLGGASASVTTDGEATEAELPIGTNPGGPYRVGISATYRIMGVVRTTNTSFSGTL